MMEKNAALKDWHLWRASSQIRERERAYVSSSVHQERDPLPKAFICMHMVEASHEMRTQKEKQNYKKSEIIRLIMSTATEVNSNIERLRLCH